MQLTFTIVANIVDMRKQESVKVELVTASTRNCQTSYFAQKRHRKENIKIIRFPSFARRRFELHNYEFA